MIIYEEILRAFQKAKIKYVLVGGIAFNLLGGERNTSDLDILVEMSDQNLAKIVKILKKQSYRVKQPVDSMGIADKATREDWISNKHMQAFNFYKEDDYRQVDIIIESPVSYKEARSQVKFIRVDNLVIPVISIEHLIKMKQKAGREIDLFDVKRLREIKKLRGKI